MSTAPLPVPLVSRTVPVDDPGPLLTRLPARGADGGPASPLVWLRRGDGLVAWGQAWRLETRGRSRFQDAAAAWRQLTEHAVVRDAVRLPGTGPLAFCSFAFAEDSPSGGVLVVPEVVLGRRGQRWWLTTTSLGPTLPSAPQLPQAATPAAPAGDVRYADGARSVPQWERVVAEAVLRIGRGELDKVVLARDLQALSSEPLDLRWVLQWLADGYPGCWTFAVDGLVGATPEMLVRREKGLVTSRVLAGTIRRTGDDQHDLALAGSLARSSKDLEEHEYAVRSVAEALEPHCSSMNVPETPFVLHLPNVMHLATDVTGVLHEEAETSLGLAAALHPSAAVCGTPTAAAERAIADLEGMDRGRYAGPVGWMDASGDGEWGIALRCGQLDPGDPRRIRLFAGCGIVAGSDPQDELAESDAKLVPMRDALGGS